MGLMDFIFGKKLDEAEFMLDLDLIEESSREVVLKRTAIESIIGRIAHTIASSNVLVKNKGEQLENDLYYRLNVMPNQNQSRHDFLYEIIYKLLLDGECLIVVTDTKDLLIADDFEEVKKAVFGNVYRNVMVDDYTFKRNFERNDVLHFKYSNNSLEKIMNGLYADYGSLIGRMFEFQMKKSQLRATVDIDSSFAKDEKSQGVVQSFIDKVYSAINKNSVAVIPQQKGLEYKEHSSETGKTESVDEIKKIKSQYSYEVARAVGYPIAFLNGDIADLDKITKNYLKLTIDPLINILVNEMNKQLFTSDEYLKGNRIEFVRVTTRDVFDLVGSGTVTGNELRENVGLRKGNDPMLDEYYLSKDYKNVYDNSVSDIDT